MPVSNLFKLVLNDLSLKPRTRKILLITTCLALPFIVAYFYFLIKYAINFPFWDDYVALLKFVTSFTNEQNIINRAGLFFVQNNEHRIVFAKAVSLLQYYLTGHLNFKILILIGNSGLLFLLGLLFTEATLKQHSSSFLILPVVALLFNFSFHELSFWAMASLQNIWVLVFAMASVCFYYQQTRCSFILSILFAVLSTFSSANGILVFGAVIFISLLQKQIITRKNILWTISGIVTGALFFYNYKFISHSGPGHVSFFKNFSFENLKHLVMFYFVFCASCLFGEGGVNYAFLSGIAVFSAFIYACYKRFYIVTPILSACATFIFITAGVAALGRYQGGASQALTSRYGINSSLLLSILFLMYGINFKSKFRVWHILICTAFISIINAHNSRNILAFRHNQQSDFNFEYALANDRKLSNFNYMYLDADKKHAIQLLKLSSEAGTFNFRGIDAESLLKKLRQDTAQAVDFKVTDVDTMSGLIFVRGWSVLPGQISDSVTNFIYLLNSADSVVKFLVPNRVFNRHFVETRKCDISLYKHAGYDARIDEDELLPGRYHLILITSNSHFKTIRNLNTYFTIK